MDIYHTPRWVLLRQRILKRDKFLCQQCRRYGKNVDATTVHHIYQYSGYPELAYKSENLISLCSKCHDEMHNRDTNQLTAKGESLKKRISPPPK